MSSSPTRWRGLASFRTAPRLDRERAVGGRPAASLQGLVPAAEPTGNVDPSLSEGILALLDPMNRERGTTVVMVTHRPRAAGHGNVRVPIDEGRITKNEREHEDAATGKPAAASVEPNSTYARAYSGSAWYRIGK